MIDFSFRRVSRCEMKNSPFLFLMGAVLLGIAWCSANRYAIEVSPAVRGTMRIDRLTGRTWWIQTETIEGETYMYWDDVIELPTPAAERVKKHVTSGNPPPQQ